MVAAADYPLEHVAYLFDGTPEGLLSAVFLAYERHEDPEDIVSEQIYEPRLLQCAIHVETDFGRTQRVRRGLVRACGRDAFTAVLRASTCEDYAMGRIVFEFVRYAMARGGGRAGQAPTPILDELANPIVARLSDLACRAVNECEKVRQFVRFSQLEGGIWFSKISPNASVVPLVMGHFASRLNDQPFIIYDERHHLAGVYDTSSWQIVRDDIVALPSPSERDGYMREAWKAFYASVAIDARYNPELRRHFMPKRLWSDLPELEPRITQGRPC